MKEQKARILFWGSFLLLVITGLVLYFIWDESFISQILFHIEDVSANGAKIRETIHPYGYLAPLLFMFLQALQVLFLPGPGEASSILSGYLFDAWPGFIYSSIALVLGSALAFMIGHLFADAFHNRLARTKVYRRFNHLVFKGDFVIPFVLFLVPGFPKDTLSYLLGISTMPFKVFIFIATIARLPGTLVLAFEGAQVYEGNYLEFLLLFAFSAIVSIPCILYRKQILEKLTHYSSAKQIEQETEPAE
jgi:uncharacterized membrane protein YdjX (TVP38/TMEM64 family)